MAKRKRTLGKAKDMLHHAGHALVGGVASRVHDEADRLMEKARKQVLVLEEKLVDHLVTVLIGVLALIFLIGALLFVLVDQAGLSRAAALGICGAVLLILAFYRRYKGLRDQGRHH